MPPRINVKKCAGCGSCVAVCPNNVLELKKGKAFLARPKDCTDCRACEAACGYDAISF